MVKNLHPTMDLRCLLVYAPFSEHTYWNFKSAVKLMGASAMQPPLGLLTVAAILPQNWKFRLVDENVCKISEEDWRWADVVCIGGMITQQLEMVSLIDEAKRYGKYVVVGGPDVSQQPEVYSAADTLILGEGEETIPLWMDSWRSGKPEGIFKEPQKPDVTKTPIPRYDLINFDDYMGIGVQYSRGCPFNCEFCDIIELYGRKPRNKTPKQIEAELNRIYELGHRGYVEFVDDNFVGHLRKVKRELLPTLIEWNKKHKYPFYYNTEASLNLADDHNLLSLMRDAEFRFIFVGIETPDPEILLKTQKSQNMAQSLERRIQNFYDYGFFITAGFIMGFDWEKEGTDKVIIDCIDKTDIPLAMVGLLTALPNTQLTRRLAKEGRLRGFTREQISGAFEFEGVAQTVDQTTGGLNFDTKRDRATILREYLNVMTELYTPENFFKRVFSAHDRMTFRPRHWLLGKELVKSVQGFFRAMWQCNKNKELRPVYWKVLKKAVFYRWSRFEWIMRYLAVYMHFHRQTKYVQNAIRWKISEAHLWNQDEDLEALVATTNLAASSAGQFNVSEINLGA